MNPPEPPLRTGLVYTLTVQFRIDEMPSHGNQGINNEYIVVNKCIALILLNCKMYYIQHIVGALPDRQP